MSGSRLVHTSETRVVADHAPRSLPVNERTCRNCGTEERVLRRWTNVFGTWVRLDCTHVQNDDEH